MARPRGFATDIARLRATRWSEDDARVVLLAQGQSGQSIEAFARAHGLVPQRLRNWQRRLASPEPVDLSIEFHPVRLTGISPAQASVVVHVPGSEIDIAIFSGVDPAWLVEIIAGIVRATSRGA